MNRGQAFLLLLLGVMTIFMLVIVSPFIEYVLLSIIVAYVLYPLHKRLSAHLGSWLSPVILMIGSTVIVVLPFIYVINRFLRDLQAIARGESDLEVEVIEEGIGDLTGVDFDFETAFESIGEVILDVLFGGMTGFVYTLLELAIGLAIGIFLVFYLLRDGPLFVQWLRFHIPLPERVANRLFDQIDRTTWGAVIGHGFAALVQAIVAGIGLYAVGIPDVFFWTFVMFLLAFLPLIGVFLIWGPAAVYLYLIGSTVEGMALAIYGLAFVSMIDYFVRPLVIDRSARLNPAVLLVAVFGGLYSMGFVGLFVGPIAVGVFVATLRTFKEDYDGI